MTFLMDRETIFELTTQLGRRLDDIMLLCNVLKIKSVPEVFEIADNVWGRGMIRAENVQLVQDFLTGMGIPSSRD